MTDFLSNFFRRRSTYLFIAVSAVLVGIKLFFDNYPGDFPLREQAAAFTWPLVLGILGIGLAGFFADRAAGLPDPLADLAREKRGLAWATIAGIVYGLITIGMYVYDYQQDPHGPDAEWVHMALPWSAAFYTFGAIFLEYLLRLGALCILFWFVHVVVLRRRLRRTVFWVLAAIVALYEIMPYMMPDIQAGHWANLAHVAIEPLYLSNVFEGWLLWRFGWFTPIVFRLAFYLVWHILFGGLAGPYFGH
jgi:hypothetical protein